MEAQEYDKLVKALRYCLDGGTYKNCILCGYKKEHPNEYCLERIMTDAAAAIEELQAELAGSKDAIRILKQNLEMKLPKRGEWIRIDKHTIQCPLCHRYLDLRGVNAGRGDANYCPNCGAKMIGEQNVE